MSQRTLFFRSGARRGSATSRDSTMSTASAAPGLIDLTIDGQPVRVPPGTSVFDAARMNGVVIPTLCHLQNETPVGVCRLCVVEAGGRVLSAACVRPVDPGM